MHKLVIILLSAFLFFSCSAERKLSRQYIEEGKFPELLVFSPKKIFKENLKIFEIEDYKQKTKEERDSLLIANSILLKHIEEEELANQYYMKLVDELKNYGFRVFDESALNDFLENTKESFVIHPAQITIDEYYKPKTEKEIIGDSLFRKTFYLNALSYNIWFEVNRLNSDVVEFPVLFSANHLYELLDGLHKQNQLTGEVHYYYDIIPILSTDIDNLIHHSAKLHASYFFDLFMNYAVSQYQKISFPPRRYFHFDGKRNLLGPANNNKFIDMNE